MSTAPPTQPVQAAASPAAAQAEEVATLKGEVLRIPGSLATRLADSPRGIVLQGTAGEQARDGTVSVRTQVGDVLFRTLARILPDKPVTLSLPPQNGNSAAALQRVAIPAQMVIAAQNVSDAGPATAPSGSTTGAPPVGAGGGTPLPTGGAPPGGPSLPGGTTPSGAVPTGTAGGALPGAPIIPGGSLSGSAALSANLVSGAGTQAGGAAIGSGAASAGGAGGTAASAGGAAGSAGPGASVGVGSGNTGAAGTGTQGAAGSSALAAASAGGGPKAAPPLAAFAVQALTQEGGGIGTLLSAASRAAGLPEGAVGLGQASSQAASQGTGRPLAFQPAAGTVPLTGAGGSAPGAPLTASQMIAQALDTLARVDSAAATQAAARLPQPGPAMAAQMVNAMAAAAAGDVRLLLGDGAVRALERAGRGDLVRGLTEEFTSPSAGREGAGAASQEWRSIPLPLLLGQEAGRIFIHFEQRPPGGVTPDGDDRRRFVIDLEMTHLGPLQIEGRYKQRRLDLAIRTTAALPADARREMAGNYADALEETNLNGRLDFLVASQDHWLRIAKARRG